jgi:hypothetical protein
MRCSRAGALLADWRWLDVDVRPNGRHSQCVLSVWMAASRRWGIAQCYLCFLCGSASLWRSKPPSCTLPILPYYSVWVLQVFHPYLSVGVLCYTSLWSAPGNTRVSSCAWGSNTQVFPPYLSVGVLCYTSLWSAPGNSRVSSCALGSNTQVFPPYLSVWALRYTSPAFFSLGSALHFPGGSPLVIRTVGPYTFVRLGW